MQYDIMKKISSPAELKQLNETQLKELCEQLRAYIIECVSQNGGHLASNLGTVELTIALHRVFNAPKDKIIFDVGHQSYTHKILTGRSEQMKTLRHKSGVSGFAKRYESEFDPFGCGHSSTSVSAALGFACAARRQGKDDFAVAVIGDGSLTGGLAYEGLNNAGRSKERIIVVINDNDISISNNVGAIARHLHRIALSGAYFKSKDFVKTILFHLPIMGKPLYDIFARTKSSIKKFFFNGNLFEDLGFTYFGPVDGHDIAEIEKVLQRAKELNRPCVVHVKTIKGCGYKPAEDDPSLYHGVAPFVPDVDLPCGNKDCFSEAFGEELSNLAAADERICAITAAMTDGVGLAAFSKAFPNRFFDVGIAEEHAVTFAAGLAAAGMVPVFACYSTFLQRAFDQILHDGAIQNLKMILAVDRAGFVGEDGETHQGLFDVSMLRAVPGITIYSPFSYQQLYHSLDAAMEVPGITAIRYPRGAEPKLSEHEYLKERMDDLICLDTAGAAIVLLTYGRLTREALAAKQTLFKAGIRIGIILFLKVFPVDFESLSKELSTAKTVLFFEEGIRSGGLGEYIGCKLQETGFYGAFRLIAVDNRFVSHSTLPEQISECGLDAAAMAEQVMKLVKG